MAVDLRYLLIMHCSEFELVMPHKPSHQLSPTLHKPLVTIAKFKEHSRSNDLQGPSGAFDSQLSWLSNPARWQQWAYADSHPIHTITTRWPKFTICLYITIHTLPQQGNLHKRRLHHFIGPYLDGEVLLHRCRGDDVSCGMCLQRSQLFRF